MRPSFHLKTKDEEKKKIYVKILQIVSLYGSYAIIIITGMLIRRIPTQDRVTFKNSYLYGSI